MRWFDSYEMAPPDPIFGLSAEFKSDPRPNKVNLCVGAYRNSEGNPHVLNSVRKAEGRNYEKCPSKEYFPIEGSPSYNDSILRLLFGPGEPRIDSEEIIGIQAPGGTGALRIGADLLVQGGFSSIFLPSPTWNNHNAIFARSGFQIGTYPYYDHESHTLKFDAMIEALKELPPKSVILLHTCCHNPTGVDPTEEQWKEICFVIKEKELFPFLDCAYQGFAKSLSKDAFPIRYFASEEVEFLVAFSGSKNFGLYGERTGLLALVSRDKEGARRALSQAKVLIRTLYSNPPINGAKIISTILNSEELFSEWKKELGNMRERIIEMRKTFSSSLASKCDQDFSFIASESGMFSFTGLNERQALRLKEESGIYMLKSGRINVAALNMQNIEYVTEAISTVLKEV